MSNPEDKESASYVRDYPKAEPTLEQIEAVVKTVSRSRARGADVRRMQAMAAEWLAYLCTRVREAESACANVAELLVDESRRADKAQTEITLWSAEMGRLQEKAGAYRDRAEAAEARVAALER